MPFYTDHDLALLLNNARGRIRFVSLAPTAEAANCRSFLALGYLQCLVESEACTSEQFDVLSAELYAATLAHFDTLTEFDALAVQMQRGALLSEAVQ
jgi:hypothetical protein